MAESGARVFLFCAALLVCFFCAFVSWTHRYRCTENGRCGLFRVAVPLLTCCAVHLEATVALLAAFRSGEPVRTALSQRGVYLTASATLAGVAVASYAGDDGSVAAASHPPAFFATFCLYLAVGRLQNERNGRGPQVDRVGSVFGPVLFLHFPVTALALLSSFARPVTWGVAAVLSVCSGSVVSVAQGLAENGRRTGRTRNVRRNDAMTWRRHHRVPQLRAWGFYAVDNRLILRVFGAVVVHALVFLQMDPDTFGTSNGDGRTSGIGRI